VQQARHQLSRVVRIARHDRVATDDATLDLVQPDHPSKLGWLAQIALAAVNLRTRSRDQGSAPCVEAFQVAQLYLQRPQRLRFVVDCMVIPPCGCDTAPRLARVNDVVIDAHGHDVTYCQLKDAVGESPQGGLKSKRVVSQPHA